MESITRRSFVGGGLAVGAGGVIHYLSASSDLSTGVQNIQGRPSDSRAFTSPAGAFTISPGGLDGGGQVTGIDIANDGWAVCRNDTETANIRRPSADTWDLAFRWGDNIAATEHTFKIPGGSSQVYEIVLAPTDSNHVWALAYGRCYKSTDRCATWSRVTTFRSGNFDLLLCYNTDAQPLSKLGGQHIAIDPADKLIVGIAHPTLGLYYSLDGGATAFVLHPDIPAPINSGDERRGIQVVFDVSTISGGKAQTVVVSVPGRGVYRSTTGIDGTFAIINATGAPPNAYVQDLAAAGGRVFCVGDGTGNDTQLYMCVGTTWSQPASVTGTSVDARRGTPATILVMTAGGGMHHSTDSGGTWASHISGVESSYNTPDVPWLAETSAAFLALGSCRWHPTLNRIYVVTGIGAFYYDSPPRTVATQEWQSITLGIRQILVMDAIVTPTGRLVVASLDRPSFQFTRLNATEQATDHLPNYTDPLRMGNGVDYCADDENKQVMTYLRGSNTTITIMLSEDGGQTWDDPATTPQFAAVNIAGGNIAYGEAGNLVWAPTSQAPMYFTKNGGTTWAQPTFGASVDMTGAVWHASYYLRRKILWNDKDNPTNFLAYCVGIDGGLGAADLACAGLWESTNGGENWTKIRGRFINYNSDYYSCKLRPVPGYAPNHLFWVRGNINSYPTAPAADGLLFSTDKGVTLTTMTGFLEVEDIGFGKPRYGNTYPRLLVRGWRGGAAPVNLGGSAVLATWECNDFDPLNPTGATWTQHLLHPGGRIEQGGQIIGDMNKYGRFYHIPQGGGFFVDDYLPL